MIHTIHIDDSTPEGKRLIAELKQYPEGVEFVNNDLAQEPVAGYAKTIQPTSAVKSSSKKSVKTESLIPEGYMTIEDFRKSAIQKANQFCDKHGID